MVPVAEDREKTNPRLKYRRAVNRSAGSLLIGRSCLDDMEKICNDKDSPCSRLVLLYARMGLHRYNLLHGKNLELSTVKKYKQSTGSATSSYYITLEAMNPALQTFETKVYEGAYGRFDLSCRIARPLGETLDESKRSRLGRTFFYTDLIPEWPSENPFENPKRYHVLNQSELQGNIDWIRLYLELAVATTNRRTIKTHDLSNLKIVKVAIDTTPQGVDIEFNSKNVAIVYIRYKDSCEARVGKDVDRVAIVRRAFMEQLGCFSLVGQTLSL